DSPHPLDQIGCTVCHEGMGQSVSFRDAAHAPSTEKQKEEWERKYHWEEPHLWDYPMLPAKMTEASCAKCHKQQVYVPKADQLNLAYATYERAGCYACHKTRGFENVRKPGPILTRIDSKLTPDWVKTWVRNPRAVKPTTWMPRIWYNSNSSTPQDAVRNEAEINAAVAYLFANSEKHALRQRVIGRYGCYSCHQIKGFESTQPIGTELWEEGSKLASRLDFAFISDIPHTSKLAWFKAKLHDPRVFDRGRVLLPLDKLRMPNFDLADEEIARLTTAIMSFQREIQPQQAMPAKSARA